MSDRRDFIKFTGLTAGSLFLAPAFRGFSQNSLQTRQPNKAGRLNFRFKPYTLQLKHAFTLATSSRTTTPVMLTEIEYNGVTGYGEASMPPYLGESHETATAFLKDLDLSQFRDPFLIDNILEYVEHSKAGNYAAKASVDIALHDLIGKLAKLPLYKLWGFDPSTTPNTSFTIGIDTLEMVRQKTEEASPYKILKVKMGRDNDKEMIQTIRTVTNKPICVDVNQGWTDRQKALDMIFWLKEQGIVFVEQPMPKTSRDDIAWLTEKSPLPIMADEAFQTIDDLLPLKGLYSGINVKLMKCGGLRAAGRIITLAKAMKMKIMIGCMTETSCAVSAAAQLSPLADWADLDGNLLISNDLYEGMKIVDGKVTLINRPGIGIRKI
jgi:L-Ala-D/L-Glu epimerase